MGLARTFNGSVAGTLRLPHLSSRARWTVAIFALVLVLAVALSFFLDEPLRRHVEGQMNARLTGYTVSIGALSFHPIGLSLTLSDLVFVQQANPDPPVGHIARLDASVQWRALLSGRLVANFALDQPRLYVNLQHLQKEAADPEPMTRKGWQEAFEAIYPLKINEFKIVDGVVTYVAERGFAPLHVSHVNFTAHNIRNIRSPEHPYPSQTHLDAVVFGTGKVVLDGRANFLTDAAPRSEGHGQPRGDRPRLLQGPHQPLQRHRSQGPPRRERVRRIRPDHQGDGPRAGDDPRRPGGVHPHAGEGGRRPGGHGQRPPGRPRRSATNPVSSCAPRS